MSDENSKVPDNTDVAPNEISGVEQANDTSPNEAINAKPAESTPPPPPGYEAVPANQDPASPAMQTQPWPENQQSSYDGPPPPPSYEAASSAPSQTPPTYQDYGTPPPVPTYDSYQQPAPGSGKAVGALVCGILAILVSWLPLVGIILGIVAIVLASQYVKAYGKDGRATGGKVTGIIGIVFSICMIVFYILFAAFLGIVSDHIEESHPRSNSSSKSSPSLSESSDKGFSADQKAVVQAAEEVAKEMCTLNDKELAAYGDYFEKEYLSYMSYTGSSTTTFADLGIDKVEFAKKWVDALAYDVEDPYIYSKNDQASVTIEFDHLDQYDFLDKTYDKLSNLDLYDQKSLSVDDVNKMIGSAMMEALSETKKDNSSWYLTMKRKGDEWVAEKSSYDSMVGSIFGYGFKKEASSSVA